MLVTYQGGQQHEIVKMFQNRPQRFQIVTNINRYQHRCTNVSLLISGNQNYIDIGDISC